MNKEVKKWVEKVGGSEEQQQWINYAFRQCGLDCVRTWEAESGWRQYAKNTSNTNGTSDSGLCQLNSAYHSTFINSEAFHDPYAQLDYCIGVWNDAVKKGRLRTTFYGYNVRNTPGVKKNIIEHVEEL